MGASKDISRWMHSLVRRGDTAHLYWQNVTTNAISSIESCKFWATRKGIPAEKFENVNGEPVQRIQLIAFVGKHIHGAIWTGFHALKPIPKRALVFKEIEEVIRDVYNMVHETAGPASFAVVEMGFDGLLHIVCFDFVNHKVIGNLEDCRMLTSCIAVFGYCTVRATYTVLTSRFSVKWYCDYAGSDFRHYIVNVKS